MKFREFSSILLAMVLGAGNGKNCVPHNIYTNDEVKADPPIEVKLGVRLMDMLKGGCT